MIGVNKKFEQFFDELSGEKNEGFEKTLVIMLNHFSNYLVTKM